MARAQKKTHPFNVKAFLSTVEGGRTISNYRKNEKVFSQGDPADAVFYIQKGNAKVSVMSESGERGHRRAARGGRLLRRGLPERTTTALGER